MRLLPYVFLVVLLLAVPSLASAQSGQILDNALRRAEQIQKLKAMDEAREREQERHEAERVARTDAEAQEPTEPPRELPTVACSHPTASAGETHDSEQCQRLE